MAYSLNFYGTEKTNTSKTVLEAFHNAENEITISIKEEDLEHATVISFDRETVIKLVKELKKQISLLEY
jgi:arsenate reductase-like glutaredoxin family protein